VRFRTATPSPCFHVGAWLTIQAILPLQSRNRATRVFLSLLAALAGAILGFFLAALIATAFLSASTGGGDNGGAAMGAFFYFAPMGTLGGSRLAMLLATRPYVLPAESAVNEDGESSDNGEGEKTESRNHPKRVSPKYKLNPHTLIAFAIYIIVVALIWYAISQLMGSTPPGGPSPDGLPKAN